MLTLFNIQNKLTVDITHRIGLSLPRHRTIKFMRQNQKIKRRVFASYETPMAVVKITLCCKRDFLSVGGGIFSSVVDLVDFFEMNSDGSDNAVEWN